MPAKPTNVVKLVVAILGVIAVLMAGGLLALAILEKHPGDVLLTALVGLANAALGALGALLVSTREAQPPGVADPVQVVNPPEQPVPVIGGK